MQFALGMQTRSLGSKFRACIGFQEAAYRTTKGTYRHAFFPRYSRNSPKRFIRCSLNPVADTAAAPVRPVEDEPLQHLAVALGALHSFRTPMFESPGKELEEVVIYCIYYSTAKICIKANVQ
jgi:hypothetical protein